MNNKTEKPDDFDGEDKPKSNCAVFGIYNHPQAAVMTYYGLHALQHRGQEASGICTSEYIESRNKYPTWPAEVTFSRLK